MKNRKEEKKITLENYNSLNDYLFYKYMCEKGNEKQQKTFLKAIGIPIKGKIKVQNETIAPEIINNKKCILDYLGETNNSIINIELQQFKTTDFNDRITYYTTKLTRLEKGNNYNLFKNIILISIVNFKMNNLKNYKHKYKLINTKDPNDIFTEKIEIIIIELKKFRKTLKDLNNKEHLYLKFFDNKTKHGERMEMGKKDKGLAEAVKRIENSIKSEEELRIYHRVQLEKVAAEKEKMRNKKRIEKKLKKTKEEGLKEGIKKGKEEKKLEIAINLKDKGIPLKIIAETTGIPHSKIKKL